MFKLNNIILVLIILFSVTFASCINETSTLPGSTGKTAELLVVANKQLYEGKVGEQIKNIFSQDVEFLPQVEPLFNPVNIIPSDLEGMFKTFRNIFIAEINPKLKEPTLSVNYDLWAQPQVVIKVVAPCDSVFIRLMNEHGNVFIAKYLETERKRMIKAFKGIENISIRSKLKKDFGFGMIFPEGYYIAVQNKNFAWVRKETEATSHNIIIYTQKFKDTLVFNSSNILNLRDSLTKKFIPGPSEGSYMTTEREITPLSKAINFKNKYAIETKGLWKLGGSCCMGGPFINFTFTDDSNKRVITIDASVYAPGKPKRDFLLQAESVVYSIE